MANNYTLVGVDQFIGDILVVSGTNPETGAGFDLCYFIEKYEPEYLTQMLGYEFYLDVMANILADPNNVPEPYADLVDGADYRDINGVLHQWKGLRGYAAEYIYYWYKRNDYTSSSLLGEATPNVDNATMRLSDQKMVKAHNDAMNGIKEAWAYLATVASSFPLYNPNLAPAFCPDDEKINFFGL